MLRFLMAGLVTVAGVVLLLMASMNDPSHALSEVRAWLPIAVQSQPTVTKPPATPVDTPPENPPAPSAAPQPQAMQQQPGKLQQQLQTLQSQYAQATQETTSLRGATDTDKQEIARLQQELAADQGALQREKVAPSTTPSADLQAMQQQHEKLQQQLEALQSRYAQATQETTSLRGTADSDKQEIARLRQQHAADQAEREREKAAATHPSVASAMPPAPSAPKAAPISQPQPPPPPKTARGDYDTADAVIDRLRHAPPPPAPMASQVIPPNQQAASAHQRLFDARAALSAGRVDDARRLLEEAQVQLVFRPTDPYGNIASDGSVAAGQVAEALSMLGAGDIRNAMGYIELAMRQSDLRQSDAAQPVMAVQSPYDLATPH